MNDKTEWCIPQCVAWSGGYVQYLHKPKVTYKRRRKVAV